jgi:hypothetical protein
MCGPKGKRGEKYMIKPSKAERERLQRPINKGKSSAKLLLQARMMFQGLSSMTKAEAWAEMGPDVEKSSRKDQPGMCPISQPSGSIPQFKGFPQNDIPLTFYFSALTRFQAFHGAIAAPSPHAKQADLKRERLEGAFGEDQRHRLFADRAGYFVSSCHGRLYTSRTKREQAFIEKDIYNQWMYVL